MSTKELLEEANKLLSSNWENHEKELVKRMIDSLIAYKSLIPKSLKNDVKAMLQMANRIKTEYDELLQKYKAEKESNNEQDNLEQIEKDLDKVKDNLEIIDNS
jgi:DNA-binding transcriptional regulator GbsR (MarR family)